MGEPDKTTSKTLGESIREEFRRGPIAVSATVVGVGIAFAALVVAWLQANGAPSVAGAPVQLSVPNLRLSNLLLVVSVFLAGSFSAASLIGFVDRTTYRFAAMVLSIPAAVLACFATLLTWHLAPPRELSADAMPIAMDIVFYGTLFVFVAINGGGISRDLFSAPNRKSANQSPEEAQKQRNADTVGTVFLLCLALMVWGTLVFAGFKKLTTLFLA